MWAAVYVFIGKRTHQNMYRDRLRNGPYVALFPHPGAFTHELFARAESGRRYIWGALTVFDSLLHFTLRNFASRIRSEFAASRIRANSRAKESGRSRSRIPAHTAVRFTTSGATRRRLGTGSHGDHVGARVRCIDTR